MDPVTSAGLAASLVTLTNLCIRGCKTIYLLQSSLKEVPREICALAEEVDTLQTLLVELQHFTQSAGEFDISPGLRSIWQRSEESLRKDLKSFESLVRKVQNGLDSAASHKRILAYMRHAVSDEKIAKHRLAFRSHIDNLNLVHNLLARQQLSTVRASLDLLASNLNGRICDGPKNVAAELQSIHNNLAALSGTMGRDNGQMAAEMNLLKEYITEMKWKKLFWKWSLYQLPIGILTVEVALSESNTLNTTHPALRKRKRTRIIFKYKPPVWFMSCVLEVAYTIFTQANKLPYWQRSKCGRLSLLPADLSTFIGESDILATGDGFLRVPFGDVLQLCKQEQLSGALIPCFGRTLCEKTGKEKLLAAEGFVITLDNHVAPSKEGKSGPSIIVPYNTLGETRLSQNSQNFALQWAALRRDYLYFMSIYKETEIPLIAQHLPRIGVPVSQDGFEDFVQYIGQHLDPQNILDFPRVDFWWMSALLFANPRFKSFISNHLASFSSPYHHSEVHRTLDAFNYDNIVHQILSSSRSAQIGFVSFLCAFGTAEMLAPLIAEGFDWNTGERKNLFLRGAVLLGNRETFEILLQVLAGTKVLSETVDDNLLHEFLSNPFPSDDNGFLDELLNQISLLHYPTAEEWPSTPGVSHESHPAIRHMLAERPYRVVARSEVHYLCGLFYTEHRFLYSNGVKFGLDDALQMLIHHQDSKKTSVPALKEALARSERYLFSRHPRKAIIVKAEELHNQTLLIDTVHFVEEGSDVLCCWVLINALKTLGQFVEEKYANVVDKITQMVGTMNESAIEGYRRSLDDRRNDGNLEELAKQDILMRGQVPVNPIGTEMSLTGNLNRFSRPAVPPYEPSSLTGFHDQFPQSIITFLTHLHDILEPLLDHVDSSARQMLALSAVDFMLLLMGIATMLAETALQAVWELLTWISTVQQVSKSTVALIGACAVMFIWKL
ncbi:MAG: hypothetical protein Q9160_004330 [Pyrenula sp. 1 TL-2023]